MGRPTGQGNKASASLQLVFLLRPFLKPPAAVSTAQAYNVKGGWVGRGGERKRRQVWGDRNYPVASVLYTQAAPSRPCEEGRASVSLVVTLMPTSPSRPFLS